MNTDNKELRHKSQDWWYQLGAAKAQEMRDKYFPEYALLTVEQRQHIYESEHPQQTVMEDKGSIEDAANSHVNKMDFSDWDYDTPKTEVKKWAKNDFKSGGEWVRENELKPLEQLCRELKDNCAELLRFKSVMENAADNLQYPDNYLAAIESVKATIEKTNEFLKK